VDVLKLFQGFFRSSILRSLFACVFLKQIIIDVLLAIDHVFDLLFKYL